VATAIAGPFATVATVATAIAACAVCSDPAPCGPQRCICGYRFIALASDAAAGVATPSPAAPAGLRREAGAGLFANREPAGTTIWQHDHKAACKQTAVCSSERAG
jgi:hypothetical protein